MISRLKEGVRENIEIHVLPFNCSNLKFGVFEIYRCFWCLLKKRIYLINGNMILFIFLSRLLNSIFLKKYIYK